MLRNNRGVLLITLYMIIAVVSVLLGIFLFRNVWDVKNVLRYKQSVLALHCAEAGMDKAIAKLPSSTMAESNVKLTDSKGNMQGEFSFTIATIVAGKKWMVKSAGYVPDEAQTQSKVSLEAYVEKKDLPDNFWDNAIYTAGDATINGNSYNINGNIRYAGSLVPDKLNPARFTGTATYDKDIAPLARFDYGSLRTLAASQKKADGSDNLYTAAEIKSGKPPLPDNFWYDTSDPNPANWIPNVVYVETDLVLNGDVGTIGGFMVVVGDVISDPQDTSSSTINGWGTIDGCVYSTGEFTVNGGGAAALNVLGGVWAGSDGVTINGSVNIGYHKPYMDAIRYNINPSAMVQLISWRKI